MRPFTFRRIITTFWRERWQTIIVDKNNRYKIYYACFLNVIYEFIDLFCVPLFMIDCILLIRLYHCIKSWRAMLANDRKKYETKKDHSDTGQDPDVEQSPELQLQPQSNAPSHSQPQQSQNQNQIKTKTNHNLTLSILTIFYGLILSFIVIAEFFWSIIGMLCFRLFPLYFWCKICEYMLYRLVYHFVDHSCYYCPNEIFRILEYIIPWIE